MTRQRGRVAMQQRQADVRLQDESPGLWDQDLGEVARSLLTSAVRCFASNGYHATTTRDISAGASLSPAALYVHFPSKEHVLYEIIRSCHAHALVHIQDRALEDAAGPEAKLGTMVSRYTEWHARHHVAARVSQYELTGLTVEHYAEVMRLRHRTNEVFRAAVASGIEDGAFIPTDVNRLVRGILSLSIDLVRWYRLDGRDSPEELGRFYADLTLKMVLKTAPGEPIAPPA